MKPANVEDIFELSPLQQGLLFHSLYAPESAVYFEQSNAPIEGSFNVPALKRAWQRVMDRHQVLRTAFYWQQVSKPLQVVYRNVAVPFREEDWRDLPAEEQRVRLDGYLRADREQRFDMSTPPLLRLALIRLSQHSWQMVTSFHHIIMDGWSKHLISREVLGLYEAFCYGRELELERPRPYSDYIGWLQQQDLAAAETFWRSRLRGFAAPTPLGIDRSPRRLVPGEEEFTSHETCLSRPVTTALHTLARQHQVTLNTVVQAAWTLVLSRYSGRPDVVFGNVVSGRPPSLLGVESMVGLFINTLPVRVMVSPRERLGAYLREVQQCLVEMRQYEYSPLVQVQAWSELGGGTSLFHSLFVFENYPTGPARDVSPQSAPQGSSFERTNYPITLLIVPNAELGISALYDCRLFDQAAITDMLQRFCMLLEAMTTNPDARLFEMPLMGAAERHRLLVDWNATEVEFRRDVCLQELFEAQAERTPEATAVVFGDRRLSYRELNERANQLAWHLRSLGVKAEIPVGLVLDRSAETAIAILGTLKAGGAYVPLDPAYPQERLAYMTADAGVRLLLTKDKEVHKLPACDGRVLSIDGEWHQISGRNRGNLDCVTKPDNLAYVIYTSGSTGKPKGVAMAHRSLVNLISWQLKNSNLRALRTLQFASLSFDVSFQELFSTWCSGGTLVLVTQELRRDPSLLLQFLNDERIERIFVPFVVLQQLAETAVERGLYPTDLSDVITAGEQLQITPSIVTFFERILRCTLHNQYGPTEAHVVTARAMCGPPSEWPVLPPIGRPIANTRIFVLDSALQPLPVGVVGELYIGGECLARGYIGDPATTADKFIPDPFTPAPLGARLYKTGDLARYQAAGEVEFLGRHDDQVKLRGFRVELGEIEAALAAHPGVREAVVVARDSGAAGKRLEAFVLPANASVDLAEDLRRFLQTKLPDYMIPAGFVFLDTLPLTPSGKVDRRALPPAHADQIVGSRASAGPRTPTEEVLTALWAEILQVGQVGVYDDFFALGGHSLLATRLASRLRSELQIEVPLRMIFERPTIVQLAEAIETLLLSQMSHAADVNDERAGKPQ